MVLEITKESVEKAIQKINQFPSLLIGRESRDYDLIMENGNRYPPILVLSEANKILGGEELFLSSFNNSTKQAFRILSELGYNIVKKKIVNTNYLQTFDYKKFVKSCTASNLYFDDQLAARFISALITKPFVILTGLSGSGKTKLALAFANWITDKYYPISKNRFVKGEKIESAQVTYLVEDTDNIGVTLIQSDTKTKVSLPYALIEDWVKVIKELGYTKDVKARTIRENVKVNTQFSSQLNSFETHLKAAAFQLISKNDCINEGSYPVCILAVGADWTNREPLLGYLNALTPGAYALPENGALQLIINAIKNPKKPYFLILDEMNLSHVERYFSDFLSAMESKEPIFLHSGVADYNGVPPSINLPNNLFVIGTVNIDETTYMFSPKVLDRANVIEFRVSESDMQTYLENAGSLDMAALMNKGVSMAETFVHLANDKDLKASETTELNYTLITFFKELQKVGAEFGYRTASEISRFVAIAETIDPTWKLDDIIDAAIMQKLLPKVHGSRRKLEPVLRKLGELCLYSKDDINGVLKAELMFDFYDREKIKYPLSLEKITRMFQGLLDNGFTSYAEA